MEPSVAGENTGRSSKSTCLPSSSHTQSVTKLLVCSGKEYSIETFNGSDSSIDGVGGNKSSIDSAKVKNYSVETSYMM